LALCSSYAGYILRKAVDFFKNFLNFLSNWLFWNFFAEFMTVINDNQKCGVCLAMVQATKRRAEMH